MNGAPSVDWRCGLALGLLHGEVADDGQLEPLTLAGFEDGNQPQDKEAETESNLEQGKQEQNQAKAGDEGDAHRHDHDHDPQGNPDNGKADGLEGVEANDGRLVVRLHDQEEDGRDDCDVGDGGGCVGS